MICSATILSLSSSSHTLEPPKWIEITRELDSAIWAQEQDGVTSDRQKQGMHRIQTMCTHHWYFAGHGVTRVNTVVAAGFVYGAMPFHYGLCIVIQNSCIVGLFKHDRSRVRVVGVGGVEKGKVGDSDRVIDRRGF